MVITISELHEACNAIRAKKEIQPGLNCQRCPLRAWKTTWCSQKPVERAWNANLHRRQRGTSDSVRYIIVYVQKWLTYKRCWVQGMIFQPFVQDSCAMLGPSLRGLLKTFRAAHNKSGILFPCWLHWLTVSSRRCQRCHHALSSGRCWVRRWFCFH